MNKLIKKHYYFVCLGLITVLAAFLRFYKLGQLSFWYDEACSISFACRPLTMEILKDHYIVRPLYFIFLNIYSRIFGINEVITRMPSAIFGIITVLLIYTLTKELFSYKTGLIAAFLLAISYFHVAWCQQVRNYALLLLTCLVSNLYYFKLIKLARVKDYWFYAIATMIAILTSPVAVFIPILHYIYYYIYVRGSIRKRIWLMIILIFSITIFMLFNRALIMKEHIKEDMLAGATVKPNIYNLARIFGVFNYGGGQVAQGATAHYMKSSTKKYHFSLNIIFFLLYFIGIFKEIQNRKNNTARTLFLIAWQWIPVLGLFFISVSRFSFLSIKLLIFTIPAYYIFISRGIFHLKSRIFISLSLLGILLLNIPSFIEYYHPNDYYSWREIATHIKSKSNKNHIIILSPLQQLAPFWLYYKNDFASFGTIGNGINGQGKRINGQWHHRFLGDDVIVWGINMGETNLFIEEMFSEKMKMKREGDFWLVVSADWIGKKEYDLLKNYFTSHFSLIEKKEYPFEGIQLFRYYSK